jgi:hypothetical protein
LVLGWTRQCWIYFPTNINTLTREEKRNYKVFFITIVLHELAHWLRFKLEAISPQNPYPGEPIRESGENLELDLLGGRMASYYVKSHGDEFKIDGVVLLLSERGQEHYVWKSPCRMLSESYFKFFFESYWMKFRKCAGISIQEWCKY